MKFLGGIQRKEDITHNHIFNFDLLFPQYSFSSVNCYGRVEWYELEPPSLVDVLIKLWI